MLVLYNLCNCGILGNIKQTGLKLHCSFLPSPQYHYVIDDFLCDIERKKETALTTYYETHKMRNKPAYSHPFHA